MGKSFYSVITEAALYTRGFGGNLEATTPVLHGLFLWGDYTSVGQLGGMREVPGVIYFS